MRILLAHSFYGSSAPSGENTVFEAERDLLLSRGHEVHQFVRYSDQIRGQGFLGMVKGGLSTPWNPAAARAIRQQVEALRPDVVHVHNTFPLLSPAIFHAIGWRAPRVLTLHNYRLFCPAAIPMRDGRVCTRCLDERSVKPALRYGCYRGSRAATAPLAFSVWLHRALGTWTKEVDAFIALTEFQRGGMIAAGLPAERVHVKPNFFPGDPQPVPWSQRGDHAVVAGRLSPEKGVDTVVRAWVAWGEQAPQLLIIGDGPQRAELERLAQVAPAGRILFLGQRSSAEAAQEIAHSKLLILPSVCFEGFPMALREAFAFGTPAAASALGPLRSIVRDGVNGVLFEPGDPQSLLQRVAAAWGTPGRLERQARGARKAFQGAYNEGANYRQLMSVYEAAADAGRGEGRRMPARKEGCAASPTAHARAAGVSARR